MVLYLANIAERRRVKEALQKAAVDALQYAAQWRGLSAAALGIDSALSIEDVLQATTDKGRAIIEAPHAVTSLTVEQSRAQAISAISFSDINRPLGEAIMSSPMIPGLALWSAARTVRCA
jgi:hypothetical protein